MDSIETLGEQHVSYLSDESRRVGYAEEICFPRNESELKQALCYDGAITIQGALTGLDGKAVPAGGRIVNLSQLKGVLEKKSLEDGGISLEVLAGTAIAEIASYEGFFFPLIPSEETATVGASVSPRTRSLFYPFYGEMCDYVLDKTEYRSKDGKIVAAKLKLKLIPEPETVWGIVFFFPTATCAKEFSAFAAQIKNAAVNEYLDHGTLKAIADMREKVTQMKALPKIPDAQAAVCVELHDDSEDAVVRSAESLLEKAEALDCNDEQTWSFCGLREVKSLHLLCHAAQEAINQKMDDYRRKDQNLYLTGAELYCVKSLDELEKKWKKMMVDYACYGNLAAGRLRLNFIPQNRDQMCSVREYLESEEMQHHLIRNV